jgi:hypothetical protein
VLGQCYSKRPALLKKIRTTKPLFTPFTSTSKGVRALQRGNLRKMKIVNAIDLDNTDNTDQWL